MSMHEAGQVLSFDQERSLFLNFSQGWHFELTDIVSPGEGKVCIGTGFEHE